MKFRKAKKEDAKEISTLIRNTLEKVNSKDYSKEIISYLKRKNFKKEVEKKIEEREGYVAIENEIIIGSVFLKDNRIGWVYVNSNFLGKGIGKKLMILIEEKAKKKGLKKVVLNPTKTALKFYEKLGYKKIKQEIWKTETFKTRVWTMEKKLK
ncbi:GNAT family N-acetyltransferase [Methanoculleus sp.]|uniref:GNAT family N-acetyltransferase n=1 Tax=Methanoculleus sp. TaxID=90427 RepID=UPI0026011CF1|nr:GNAT family N-acetyltransferase [Methanoculleus sp.]MCK9319933.1 GNAT family N-acetyltransferase [Methanoculleus sp.]